MAGFLQNISVRWKILGLALLGPILISVIAGYERISDIRQGAENGILEKSKAIVLMAEAARDEMADKLRRGVIRPFEEIPAKDILEAVPVVTAMEMAQVNAKKAGYEFKAPKESPRNPANTPTAQEKEVLDEFRKTNIQEKVIVEKDRIRYFRPVRLTEECLYCHGDPKGTPDVVGGIKEGWKVGEIHGAFQIISSLDAVNAQVRTAAIGITLWTLGILAVISVLVYVAMNMQIITPLMRIIGYAEAVAGGDLDSKPVGSFYSELAKVKEAIAKMVENLKGKMSEAQNKSAEAMRERERAEGALRDSKIQEEKVVRLLDKMTHVAMEAAGIASQLSSASEELAAQVDEVSKGAGIQDQRTSETATAMEEMNATVLEVARNSSSAAQSADKARSEAEEGAKIVEEAVMANDQASSQAIQLKGDMGRLGKQAESIGRILDVISDIADQTNLLALNAAIEAARAGEAGRGFAVVADEVRKLAEKTMQATKEVGTAIQNIQQGAAVNVQNVDEAVKAVESANALAKSSGEALRRIVGLSIHTADEVRSIATAAEEQSAASEEINRAVEDISRITAETSEGMNQSAQAVTELAQLAHQLNTLIGEMTEVE
ncbi:MAG: DUF3365 domain-containing protein [Deltaproteobacteria bacterium]|nr:DUF3365 domain-containing protein [Deltaproteobacteria bacterium]